MASFLASSPREDLRRRREWRSVLWAAIGGGVAAVVIGVPMHLMGMLVMGPAALVGSENVWTGWVVHLVAGVFFAAPYGLYVRERFYGRGLLFGLGWGLFVGIVFAWIALFSILGMPLFTPMGAIDVAMHVVWGGIVGVVSAWGLRRTTERGGASRRMAQRA